MNKTDKMKMWFLAPDDGGESGSAAGTAVFDNDPIHAPTEKVEETAAPEKVETPPTATLDPKEFAREFGGVIAAELGKSREQPDKPLTPEEAKKLLNVWDPTPEWIAKFDNLDTRNAAIAEMRDGVVKHSDTISQHRLREAVDALKKEFGPGFEAVRQMQHEQRQARFDKTFPQLAKPTLQPLIQAVAQKMVDGGKQFKTEAEMFEAIGKEVETVIKETNADFKLERASGSIPAKTKPANAIPVTTPGSGGGTGSKGGGKETPQKRGLAIFGKD